MANFIRFVLGNFTLTFLVIGLDCIRDIAASQAKTFDDADRGRSALFLFLTFLHRVQPFL